MQFPMPLQTGILMRRYQRFLADIEDQEGHIMTIHCPNTGSMTTCAEPGSRVWYWDSQNSKRKYRCTWELVEVGGRYLACINTQRANQLVVEAIEHGMIKPLQDYTSLCTEVHFGQEKSRVDICLMLQDQRQCYVEVKNVTWRRNDGGCNNLQGQIKQCSGRGAFPDAITTRGRKHLRELAAMVAQGQRGVLLFCVAHTGINRVAPAWDKDPYYAEALLQAVEDGVEVYAYGAAIDGQGATLTRSLPIDLARPT